MKIYVKYCGGCNPRYDRAALTGYLVEHLAQHTFTGEPAGQDVSLIVCGCASACAAKSDAAAPYGVFTIWQSDAADEFIAFINGLDVTE